MARGGNRHTDQDWRLGTPISRVVNGRERTSDPPILVMRKARRILDAFSPERPTLDFQDIRAATGLRSTTCLRLVRNLVN